jgi:hypothetical protein
MAIDLEALAAKHAELTKPAGSNQNSDFLSNFIQLREGTNLVRILPGKDDDTLFYAETKIHRIPSGNGQTKNVHCRKVQGEKCPLCDAYYALWDRVNRGEKEYETTARQIKARERYYLNVVDRETGDVKILSIGQILFKKIVASMLDPDFGDITDLNEGHDFKIVKIMDGQWPKYDQSQPRPKSEKAGSAKEIAGYMEQLHAIHDLVKVEDYEDVKQYADMLLNVRQGSTPRDSEDDEEGSSNYLTKLQS